MRINIRAMTPDERGFSYTQPDLFEATGCIGHLRVDMGNTGTQFFSSWDDHQADLKTAAFKTEFDQFINAMRNDPEHGEILRSRATLASYCLRHPDSGFENSREYGFRADTDKYSYLLRLNPKRGEKGIKIIAPAISKKKVEKIKLDTETNAPLLDENGQAIMEEKEISIPRFRVATVFDVSQTEGEPLPELAATINGDVKHYEAFLEALERSSPVPVSYDKMSPECDGVFRHGEQSIGIRQGMSEVQTVAALVHEITHAKLHNAVFPAKDDPTSYQEVNVLGQAGLFSPERMDGKDLPRGLFKYELRCAKDKPTEPGSIENKVSKDFFGTVVTAKPVELSKTGFHELSDPGSLTLLDKSFTLKEFYHDHKKDRNTQEVEAESVAYSVCQYYGIETGENSFGYLASWSSSKEVSELKDSLTTITATADALITDIDRNFREVCKERGIDPKEVIPEPEPVTLDAYPMPDPNMSADAIESFGEDGKDLLPVGKELAQSFYDENQEVFYAVC